MSWLMAVNLIKRFWPILLAIAAAGLIAVGLWSIYNHGYSAGLEKANADWQKKWDKRNSDDAVATAEHERKEREKEKAFQKSIEQATKDAQQKIDSAKADAAVADGASKRLQQRADAIATQLASSQASFGACSATSSNAAAQAARVYANVLKSLDDRAGKLAAVADEAIERGNACAASYNALRSQNP